VVVIFGITGDLSGRLLFPSLYNLALAGLLPPEFAIVGLANDLPGAEELRAYLSESLRAARQPVDPQKLEWMLARLSYIKGDFTDAGKFQQLVSTLREVEQQYGTQGNVLFYLATAPQFFLEIAQRLNEAGLLRESEGRCRRLIIEKPFGEDLSSARELNRGLTALLAESQIYRIDHYLGKETVQNILVFRFGNGIFEPIWNRRYIDHVQITVAETLGVEARGRYYDHTGALRDMIPNHLVQLLTFTAMEPPTSFAAHALHTEQMKVLEVIPPVEIGECDARVVRAQYEAGAAQGRAVPGYRQEPFVAQGSPTETYVALKLAVDNWRWAGVPFYLRTGKRLAVRRTTVVIQFRKVPLSLFRSSSDILPEANRLVINVQPEERIDIEFAAKVPGPEITPSQVAMRFSYGEYFGAEPKTGYETLLYDAMIGDASLFKRGDVIEGGWAIVDPIIDGWSHGKCPLHLYAAGSEGPQEGDDLLRRDGREWRPLG
jgi:glucose-6-phosphate 1-dehydrogenase